MNLAFGAWLLDHEHSFWVRRNTWLPAMSSKACQVQACAPRSALPLTSPCLQQAPPVACSQKLRVACIPMSCCCREVDFTAFRRFFMLLPRTEMALEFW